MCGLIFEATQITVAMLVTDSHIAMSTCFGQCLNSEEVLLVLRYGAQELAVSGECGRMRSDVRLSMRYNYLRRKCKKQRRRPFDLQNLIREVRPLG